MFYYVSSFWTSPSALISIDEFMYSSALLFKINILRDLHTFITTLIVQFPLRTSDMGCVCESTLLPLYVQYSRHKLCLDKVALETCL